MTDAERTVEAKITESILVEIASICEKQRDCNTCPLNEIKEYGNRKSVGCLLALHSPMGWNVKKIAEVVANDKA